MVGRPITEAAQSDCSRQADDEQHAHRGAPLGRKSGQGVWPVSYIRAAMGHWPIRLAPGELSPLSLSVASLYNDKINLD